MASTKVRWWIFSGRALQDKGSRGGVCWWRDGLMYVNASVGQQSCGEKQWLVYTCIYIYLAASRSSPPSCTLHAIAASCRNRCQISASVPFLLDEPVRSQIAYVRPVRAPGCRGDNCSKYLSWQPFHSLQHVYQLSHLIALVIWRIFTCIHCPYIYHVKINSAQRRRARGTDNWIGCQRDA
jgi:hypothetical protein